MFSLLVSACTYTRIGCTWLVLTGINRYLYMY